jgi:group I intron endonuclease
MAIEVRLREHKAQLIKGAHQCPRLQRAFMKYGSDAFLFEILKSISVDELDAAEQALLDEGFAAGNLYNTAKCAEAPARGTKHSEERKAQASEYRKKLFSDPEHLAKHTAAIRKGMTAEVRAKISSGALADSKGRSERMQALRKQWQQDGTMDRALSKRGKNAAWRDKVQAHVRNWRSDEASVAAHDASICRRSENLEWQARMRRQNEGFAQDPSWRAAVIAGHRTDEARANHGTAARAVHARLKADPVAYLAWKTKISESKKARFAACRQS